MIAEIQKASPISLKSGHSSLKAPATSIKSTPNLKTFHMLFILDEKFAMSFKNRNLQKVPRSKSLESVGVTF